MTKKGTRIVIDGIELGAIDVRQVPALTSPGPIKLDLAFRPNWVGIWKLQAAIADKLD